MTIAVKKDTDTEMAKQYDTANQHDAQAAAPIKIFRKGARWAEGERIIANAITSHAKSKLNNEEEKDAFDEVSELVSAGNYNDDVRVTLGIVVVMSQDFREQGVDSLKKSTKGIDAAFELYERAYDACQKLKGFEELAFKAQLVTSEEMYSAIYQPRVKLNLFLPKCQGCGGKLKVNGDWISFEDNGYLDIELHCSDRSCGFTDSLYGCHQNSIRLTAV